MNNYAEVSSCDLSDNELQSMNKNVSLLNKFPCPGMWCKKKNVLGFLQVRYEKNDSQTMWQTSQEQVSLKQSCTVKVSTVLLNNLLLWKALFCQFMTVIDD